MIADSSTLNYKGICLDNSKEIISKKSPDQQTIYNHESTDMFAIAGSVFLKAGLSLDKAHITFKADVRFYL